ncbi:MAG: hypothetical protein ABIM99_02485 [Candidatus Dojkabacteria bacterium]
MNNQESLERKKFIDTLLDNSLDSGVPLELRGKSIDEIQAIIDSIEDEKLRMNISKWDFAPEEKIKIRDELMDKRMELFKLSREIKDDDKEKEMRKNAIFAEIDAMDFSPGDEPEEYDATKYEKAVKQRELEVEEIEKNKKRKIDLNIVIKNIESLEEIEFRRINISMEMNNQLFSWGGSYRDIPFLYLPEGFVDLILNESINNKQSAWKHIEEILREINSIYVMDEKLYKSFINHLQGHKAMRQILFKKGADENKTIEFAKLVIPIYDLPNSLPANGLTNYYDYNYHTIIWRYPEGTILEDKDEYQSLSSDGKEVVFKGSAEDSYYEIGCEENAHAFYFKEETRDVTNAQIKAQRKEIKYTSQPHELNALYAILAGYILKYGSEENIPTVTYNVLMDQIRITVEERISNNVN